MDFCCQTALSGDVDDMETHCTASTCLVQTWDRCGAIAADVRPWKGATRASFVGMHDKEGQMLQSRMQRPDFA